MPTIVAYDIETVPISYDLLSPVAQARLVKETARIEEREGLDTSAAVVKAASLHPALGMVCAIGIARYDEQRGYVAEAFKAADLDEERVMLEQFWAQLEEPAWTPYMAVSFNGKWFDAPFLKMRSLVHGLVFPHAAQKVLNEHRWKSRPHFDLMHVSRYAMGLADLCATLGVESPKDDIDGSQVYEVFQQEGGLLRIAAYAARDAVKTLECYHVLQHQKAA
ncbi:MAG: ribonuclease H-like domain-containing protein [Bacteroidota bacterium]